MKRAIQKTKYILDHEGLASVIIRPYKRIIRVMNLMLISIFGIAKVRDNKIILESQGDYTDNVRAFSDYLLSIKQKEYEVIWLVQNPKYFKARFKGNFISRNEKHINIIADYHIATSKFLIFSHPYWLNKWRDNQIVINTTHSVAQLKASSNKSQKKLYEYVLTCSDYCTKIRQKTFFDDNASHFICIGQPRLDLMFSHRDCKQILFEEKKDLKLILCMETFKQTTSWDDGGDNDTFAINVIKTSEELKCLDLFLAANKCFMVVKIHHLQDMKKIKEMDLSNIVYMRDSDLTKHNIQVNELLENADVLLTDYSSVFYDFLLTDRPIGFLIGDIDEYKRGFMMEDPLSEMPGKKIKDFNELTEFINEIQVGHDYYKLERKTIRDKVFKYQDNDNSKRLMDWIINHTNSKGR